MKNLNSKSVSGKNLFPVNRFRRVVVLLLSVTISLATLGMMGSFINRMGKATTAYAQEEVSILAAPVQQTSGSEYIQNGDFEAGFSNWETSANASWSATGGFPNGRAAISLYESISQTIPSGNETGIYRLSYNAIGSHGVYWVKATITIESSDQNTAVASQVTGELTNSSWVTGTMDLLLVSGETYTLTFKTTSTGLSNRTTYLDNISLQKYVDVEDMDTGVITNGEFIGSTGWDYSAGASFGATGGMTTTQLGAALILKAGGGWITQTNGFAISGTQPVTYQLSLDCISVNGSYGAVGYHRLESSDLNESPKEVGLNCNNAPSGWTHNEVFFTLTPGNTYTYSARYGWGAGAVSGFWLDNVSLVKFEPIKDSMVVNKETTCTGTGDQSGTQGIILDPINPRNGNFMYLKQDIVMPVAGCLLEFQRAYASDTIDYYTSTMGYGWTHNYDMRLHFADTAIPGTVEVQTPSGSRLPFYDNGDGTYTPYAGVTAELVEIGSTYVITGFNQKVYTFDAQGLLLEQADPYGNVITFTYNTNDQLIQAGQGNRTLSYAYDGSDRLTSVMDNLNREITLEYNTHGDLITVTNTLGLATTYEYSGATHLLTKVTDPSGTVLEETAYDNEGRAYRQWDGEGNLLGEIDYSIANTRVVTENGVVMTYTYDTRNTLVGIEYACTDGTAGCQVGSSIAYDGNFKQDDVVDLNGNPTTLDWNEGGSNLEYVKDALDNETFLAYDQYNNLTQTIDARDNATQYFYDNPNFPTFLTRMTNALDKTTYYTPTTTLDGVPGLLKQQEDPDGRITTYTYNDFGQITEVVVAAGTSDAVTTAYGYDAVGRLITTTQSSVTESHTNLNVYDDGDRLVATVANWDGVLDWQNCSFAAGPREENVCTLYGYDDAGRIISTTNALGQTN